MGTIILSIVDRFRQIIRQSVVDVMSLSSCTITVETAYSVSTTATSETEVIYSNPSRTSMLDDGATAAAPAVEVEILEGDDESKFVEKTLAPSGRPWVSVPSLSERVLMMSTVAGGNEIEVADGTDGEDSFSDTRRAAVMD
jgi:hypothetical protein